MRRAREADREEARAKLEAARGAWEAEAREEEARLGAELEAAREAAKEADRWRDRWVVVVGGGGVG